MVVLSYLQNEKGEGVGYDNEGGHGRRLKGGQFEYFAARGHKFLLFVRFRYSFFCISLRGYFLP